MDALRLFLAIDIPPFAREKITEVQNRLKSLDLNASWVKPGNIHLTLKFLGDTPAERVQEIKASLKDVLASVPSFSMSLGQVGVFPNPNRPRVLWVGLENPDGQLISLQQRIERQMVDIGFPSEFKKFNPHLTFGRIKSLKGKGRLKSALEEVKLQESEPFVVREVRLYRSELSSKGSIYTMLEEFTLGEPS